MKAIVKEFITTAIAVVLLGTAFYLNFALARYRFAHPEKTETQLFLDMPHWIRWPTPP